MGNECKTCTQDARQISIPTQQNIITQSHQYSFGMNCIDNDVNFEFSSVDISTVPQFGFEQQKLKADLFPPQALRAASEDSITSLLDQEETIEQQIKEDIRITKQIKRFQSQEEYYNTQQSIRMRYIDGSYLTASSEAQLQQQQQSQRSIQKQRQLIWDCRTVNKELKQKKKESSNQKTNPNSKTILLQSDQQGLSEKEKPKRKTHTSHQLNQAREDDNQIKPNEKRKFHPKIKKDEFVQYKINYQSQSQRSDFLKYD
ncbi:unnamed protein product (macronuclear) [Paramecium tetraurelia]|uniref:Uncharacterized protein n=1 Tax=Paramecium tetraurelia TaxID=5888 RepID=A0BIH3_PARTE|nr:uncharacterized protein GSPATT00004712001 [Paramecium tetraurelia]CAK58340.1 unnamed protein product [Paramecium tetraurelia]|eukprot:XP_001425738.1 hypothetical protein (macronuclear) [Paramecium tetraurelia strain d4-2]